MLEAVNNLVLRSELSETHDLSQVCNDSTLKLVSLETPICAASLPSTQNDNLHFSQNLANNSCLPSRQVSSNADKSNNLTITSLDCSINNLVNGDQLIDGVCVPPGSNLIYVQKILSNGSTVNVLEPRERQSFLVAGKVVHHAD